MNSINICIAGLGNVGSALVQLIEKNAELVKLKSELNINIIGLLFKYSTYQYIYRERYAQTRMSTVSKYK